MTQILLVGSDEPLLEGLAQSLASLGCAPRVAFSANEAREIAFASAPLVAVIDRATFADAGSDALGLPLAPGGAIILYRPTGSIVAPLPMRAQRQVLADIALPLERNRLVALIQHVQERAIVTGRSVDPESRPPEQPAV